MLRLASVVAALAIYIGGCVYAAAQSAPPAAGLTGIPFTTQGGHVISGGPQPTASSGCGTGAVISGSDSAGNVTAGTSPGTCTLTFGTAYTNRPSCVVTAESYTPAYTVANTSITISNLAAGRTNWWCVAPPGG